MSCPTSAYVEQLVASTSTFADSKSHTQIVNKEQVLGSREVDILSFAAQGDQESSGFTINSRLTVAPRTSNNSVPTRIHPTTGNLRELNVGFPLGLQLPGQGGPDRGKITKRVKGSLSLGLTTRPPASLNRQRSFQRPTSLTAEGSKCFARTPKPVGQESLQRTVESHPMSSGASMKIIRPRKARISARTDGHTTTACR